MDEIFSLFLLQNMDFVCEWEVFEIIEKAFLQGDTSLPAAQGELSLLLLMPGWPGPAKHHAAHLHWNRHGHEVHEVVLCTHMDILREIRQDF